MHAREAKWMSVRTMASDEHYFRIGALYVSQKQIASAKMIHLVHIYSQITSHRDVIKALWSKS